MGNAAAANTWRVRSSFHRRRIRKPSLSTLPPERYSRQHRFNTQGWKKPGFLKKNPAQWVFLFFWGFLVFFFLIYLPRREKVFMVFSVSRILLGASKLYIIINLEKIEKCSIYVHIYLLNSIFDSISINGTRPFQPRIFLSAQSSFFLHRRRISGKYLSTYGECAESI